MLTARLDTGGHVDWPFTQRGVLQARHAQGRQGCDGGGQEGRAAPDPGRLYGGVAEQLARGQPDGDVGDELPRHRCESTRHRC